MNSAKPVADGKCCDTCHKSMVIPSRSLINETKTSDTKVESKTEVALPGFKVDAAVSLPSRTKEKKFDCVICKKSFAGWGNNAAPVADGKCCDDCNGAVVIPARFEAVSKPAPVYHFHPSDLTLLSPCALTDQLGRDQV